MFTERVKLSLFMLASSSPLFESASEGYTKKARILLCQCSCVRLFIVVFLCSEQSRTSLHGSEDDIAQIVRPKKNF